jgi:hypothetical protein
MPSLLQVYQRAKDRGRTRDDVVHLMHQRGLTITDAIKAYMKIYKVSLAA